MRILIATAHRNMVGGVEKYLQRVIPALINAGHQAAMLYDYRFDPVKERIDPPELNVPCCGASEEGPEAGLRFARQWKPDIVYSQGIENHCLQSTLLNDYPTVLYAHNYIGTCISGEKCHAFPVPRPCDRQFGPTCALLYLPRRCGGLNPATMWKMYRAAQGRNADLRRYAAILVASSHMRSEFERHGVSPDRIGVAALPNPAAEQAPSRSPSANLPNRLLFLGRLTKLKGGSQLLRAIPLAERKLGRRLSLTVAGDGPERSGLQATARRKNIDCTFTGWIGNAEKNELLAQADLLVLPSLWPEPFGLVGIEAGAHGVPAAGFDVGGVRDWLIEGYSGEVAPGNPPTVEGLAGAICRAVADPDHHQHLCRGAREVAGRFHMAAHLRQLESTFESVLLDRKPNLSRIPGDTRVHADA